MYKISLVSFELFIRGKNKFHRNISQSSFSQRNPFSLPEATGSLVMYRVGEIKESLAFPKAIGEVKGWGLRKIRGWQRMLSRGKERGQGRNQYVLTVWNAFQLVSRRDKIKNSPFCELLLLSRNDQALKNLPFYVLRLRYKLLIFSREQRDRERRTDENFFPSLSHRDDLNLCEIF